MPELLISGQFGTEAQATRVNELMQSNNKRGRRPLTPFEAKQLADGEMNPIYIYNISPIHRWARPQGQLGTVVIQPRAWDRAYSDPFPIKGAIVRWYKTGLGADQPFIEGGMELAQDVCGLGPLADGKHPNSNLSNYGVFVSMKPFDPEFLPEGKRRMLAAASGKEGEKLLEEFLCHKSEKKRLILDAQAKLLEDLQIRILEADNWHMGGAEARKFIGPWHRECLRAFNNITGKKESRPWASIIVDDALIACEFCGNSNKPGLAKCPKCMEIIDMQAYNELKARIGG